MNKLVSISALIALALSTPAMANKVKKLTIKAPAGFDKAPVVTVYSTNGEKWNKVDKTKETTFRIGLNADCKYEGKGNKAYRGNFSIYGFTQVGDEDPADFLIPHAKEAKAKFRFNKTEGFDFVGACKTELQKRLSQNADLTKYHVLAKGFTVKYPAAITAQYYLQCRPTGLGFTDTSTKTVKVNTKINCAGSDLAKAKIPKPKPKPIPVRKATFVKLIKDITFKPNKKNIVSTCPVQVEFNGKITANRAGTVEYQYVSHDKRTSPKFTLKFDKAGTKALRVWKRTINKESAKDKLTFSTGEKKAYDYKGWYKLVVLSPKGQKTIKSSYTLNCVEAGNRR